VGEGGEERESAEGNSIAGVITLHSSAITNVTTCGT